MYLQINTYLLTIHEIDGKLCFAFPEHVNEKKIHLLIYSITFFLYTNAIVKF